MNIRLLLFLSIAAITSLPLKSKRPSLIKNQTVNVVNNKTRKKAYGIAVSHIKHNVSPGFTVAALQASPNTHDDTQTNIPFVIPGSGKQHYQLLISAAIQFAHQEQRKHQSLDPVIL